MIKPPKNYRGPIVTLTLPESADEINVQLLNNTTGKTMTLELGGPWDGDDLTLDFFRRTIVDQTGADRSALLSPLDQKLWVPQPLLANVENDFRVNAIMPIRVRDDFNQTAGNVTGKKEQLGNEYAGAGDADDFVVEAVNHRAQRTAVSDSSINNGRFLVVGPELVYTKTVAEVSPGKAPVGGRYGILARYQNTTNWLRLCSERVNFGAPVFEGQKIVLEKCVAGVVTVLKATENLLSRGGIFRLVVDKNGRVSAYNLAEVVPEERLLFQVEDADLKSTGALNQGKGGLYDAQTSATAATRIYDGLRIYTDTAGVAEAYAAEAKLSFERGYY